MDVNERVKLVRKSLGKTQTEFGERISVSQNHLTGVEKGVRKVTDRMIKLICSEFNVNEEWLRYGIGEMFVQSDTFSLDEYARLQGVSELELDILRAYMSMDKGLRQQLVAHFKAALSIPDPEEIEEQTAKYQRDLVASKLQGEIG